MTTTVLTTLESLDIPPGLVEKIIKARSELNSAEALVEYLKVHGDLSAFCTASASKFVEQRLSQNGFVWEVDGSDGDDIDNDVTAGDDDHKHNQEPTVDASEERDGKVAVSSDPPESSDEPTVASEETHDDGPALPAQLPPDARGLPLAATDAPLPSSGSMMLPVTFGGVSIGESTARLGVKIDRGSINIVAADDIFCGHRLTGSVSLGEYDDSPGQATMFEDMELVVSGSFDVKRIGVNRETISTGLTFSLADVDIATLAKFSKGSGRLVVENVGDIPDGEPDEHGEGWEPRADDDPSESTISEVGAEQSSQEPDSQENEAQLWETVSAKKALGLSKSQAEKLEAVDVRTMRQFEHFRYRGPGLQSLSRIGAEKAAKIYDAADEWLKANANGYDPAVEYAEPDEPSTGEVVDGGVTLNEGEFMISIDGQTFVVRLGAGVWSWRTLSRDEWVDASDHRASQIEQAIAARDEGGAAAVRLASDISGAADDEHGMRSGAVVHVSGWVDGQPMVFTRTGKVLMLTEGDWEAE